MGIRISAAVVKFVIGAPVESSSWTPEKTPETKSFARVLLKTSRKFVRLGYWIKKPRFPFTLAGSFFYTKHGIGDSAYSITCIEEFLIRPRLRQ